MKITIMFTDEKRTHAIVTRHPSWAARLFGRKPVTADVQFDPYAPYNWRYAVDHDYVDWKLAGLIDWNRKWQQTEPLPIAELRRLPP